jgi:Flp pilus assembly protein TadG
MRTAQCAPRQFQIRTRGQAAIMMALSIPLMFGLLAMVVDVGWAYWRAEACKTAAQAAAFAAARQAQLGSSLACGAVGCQGTTANCPATPASPPSNNLIAGCLYAKQNGFTNSGKQQVMYQANTSGSPVAGPTPNYWIRFTVTEQIPTLFAAVFSQKNLVVSSRATAGVFTNAAGACIYALDPVDAGAISMVGTSDVESGCGVWDNSASSSSLSCTNNTTLNVTGGSITLSGGNACRGTVSPAPTTNQPQTADPFAGVPLPTAPSRCDSYGLNAGDTVTMPSDGYYVICGGGGITMTGNSSLTLPAGIYILQGGGLDWHNGTISGSGVTIYETGPNANGNTINGNMVVNLSAPTSGSYKGLVIFRDRTLTSPPSDKYDGGAGMNFNGTIYVPGSAVEYAGGSATSITALVAYSISFKGNSTFGADTTGSITGINSGGGYSAYIIE